ncbi:hypothetical protein P0E69_08350 [Chimaeribacter arupi]|uniref:Uncharacterized protein n=1 Tax=Chimaeribacter arupi TaxID=2060066 RepID=A0A2N5ELU0_9GAMM|nr:MULTISPECIES: hypothetical protein [Yersiniaceae]PLR48383.1 hypothetical protein CYR34_12865 [Chimaeribacter arupi]WKZ93877.1 hypothetical protein P0E69_08350 [Chimaeribacter arupi]
MRTHPNKHIQAAIDYALSQGWTFLEGRGHAFGRLYCGTPHHKEHMMSIWSTPAVPERHARQIRRKVERCLPADGTSANR